MDRWQALIDSGTYRNTVELAMAIGKDPAFVARMIRLTLLAPEIVHAILSGTLQRSVPVEKRRKEMPIHWEDQKEALLGGVRGLEGLVSRGEGRRMTCDLNERSDYKKIEF